MPRQRAKGNQPTFADGRKSAVRLAISSLGSRLYLNRNVVKRAVTPWTYITGYSYLFGTLGNGNSLCIKMPLGIPRRRIHEIHVSFGTP
jgi:hypothetical protein